MPIEVSLAVARFYYDLYTAARRVSENTMIAIDAL